MERSAIEDSGGKEGAGFSSKFGWNRHRHQEGYDPKVMGTVLAEQGEHITKENAMADEDGMVDYAGTTYGAVQCTHGGL